MSQAVAPHDFTAVKQDNTVQITYKKGRLGFRNYASMLWPALLLSIFLSYQKIAADPRFTTPQEKLWMGIFYTIVFTIFLPLGVWIVLNLLRRDGHFNIKPEGIELKGKTYPWAEIKGIYTKSPSGEVSQSFLPQQTNMVFAWSNDRDFNMQWGTTLAVASAVNVTVGAATWLSRISGQEFMKSLRRVSHKICFRYGKTEMVLASGMSPDQAADLFHNLEKLLKS